MRYLKSGSSELKYIFVSDNISNPIHDYEEKLNPAVFVSLYFNR